jgi:hypothetical protein
MSVILQTANADNMALLNGNIGGAAQQLPGVNFVGGKERLFIEHLTLAGQSHSPSAAICIARIPVGGVFLGITALTDTSLGSSVIQFGNSANNDGYIYGTAKTLTAIDTPTSFANHETYGKQITTGYDGVSGNPTTPQNNSGYGGAYEDILLIVGTADLPASGNLIIITRYSID